jgi:light-regulated signal transduction histidine kinase (bacteriophytochrome)
MIMAPELKMEHTKKLAPEVVTQLRRLAHDLSNSIETITQASYLLSQTRLDANGKKWNGMIESAAQDAAKINQGLREMLRSQSQRNTPRRRAS